MEELQYEMAIASYTKVIEIDPKNVDAYLGLADCYEQLDNHEEAIDILITGYQNSEDEALISRIEEEMSDIIFEYNENKEYTESIAYIDSISASLKIELLSEER